MNHYVAFLRTINVGGRQVYWLMHKHQGQSKFTNSKLEKVLKVPATRRNSSTVQKIVTKFFGEHSNVF